MEMEVNAVRGWRVYSKNDAAPFLHDDFLLWYSRQYSHLLGFVTELKLFFVSWNLSSAYFVNVM